MHAWIFKSFSLIHSFINSLHSWEVSCSPGYHIFSLGNVAKLFSSINSLKVKFFWQNQNFLKCSSYSTFTFILSFNPQSFIWSFMGRCYPKFTWNAKISTSLLDFFTVTKIRSWAHHYNNPALTFWFQKQLEKKNMDTQKDKNK